jgi:hypothetical protein
LLAKKRSASAQNAEAASWRSLQLQAALPHFRVELVLPQCDYATSSWIVSGSASSNQTPLRKTMNENPMDQLRQWALQTVTFAIAVENAAKTGVSQEVVEQTAISASRISNQFFAESAAAYGADAERVDRVFLELVNRVLDWVAERRGTRVRD